MPAEPIIVIDAGTSALRASAVAADGAVTPIASEAWPIFTPEDCAPFGREIDLGALSGAFTRLTEAARRALPQPAAIAFTGQREGVVLAAQDRAVLISPNVDARASGEGAAIDARHAADVYDTTGHLPSLLLAPAKLAWLRANRRDDGASVDRIMPLADWLASQLDSEQAISRSLAIEIGVADAGKGERADGLLRALCVEPDLVPRIVRETSTFGIAAAGPWSGTPVVRAGGDTQCALAGMGAVAAGDCGVAAGWSAPAQLATPAPVIDSMRRTWTGAHVAKGAWVLESNAGEAGRAWDAVCSMMGVESGNADEVAASSPAGSRDVMSVLGPRVMNASNMRAGSGAMMLPLPFVMNPVDHADALRSVLEGIAFAIRANIEQLEEVSKTSIGSVALGSGMSRSRLFCSIVSSVLGRPLSVAGAAQTTAVGAAAVAATALGRYTSLAEASVVLSQAHIVDPDARESALYDDCYTRWCELAAHMEQAP